MIETVEPEFLVKINDHLRVASGLEPISLRLERGTDSLEVIDFTVARNYDVAVLTLNRLCPRREVNHRQSCVPDDDLCGFVDEDAAAVRATVLERIKDVFEFGARKALTYRTEDPTHLPSSNIEPGGSAL